MHNVLVIGSGAREAALGVKFLASDQVEHVYVAPGNPGMELVGLEPVAIDVLDFDGLIDFADKHVDLTFVGPEVPLVAGVVDAFLAAGLTIFGVNKNVAQLEGSKTYAKNFMARHHLPTAKAREVFTLGAARVLLEEMGTPVVIKADGLAGGKGVTVALTRKDADTALAGIYLNDEHAPVLLEEYLTGQEASVMALYAQDKYVILPLSQDHKRRFNGDAGPNTGGMGAISPASQFNKTQVAQANELMVQTIAALNAEGDPGCGVIYMGLMFTQHGPKILEYNMRFGDPETQLLLPQIQNDFYALVTALLGGEQVALKLNGRTYVDVVLAHPAYPASSHPQLPVVRPSAALLAQGVWLPAAVNVAPDGALTSAGGRIVTVIGDGVDVYAARCQAYARVFELAGELAYREDIGVRAL